MTIESGPQQRDFSLEIKKIDEELAGGGDVGNFLIRDLGLLIAAERPVSLDEILDYKAGSLRELTPERAESQKKIHEQALQKLISVGVIIQQGDSYALADSGPGKAWIDSKIASGNIQGVIEIGKEFLLEQELE